MVKKLKIFLVVSALLIPLTASSIPLFLAALIPGTFPELMGSLVGLTIAAGITGVALQDTLDSKDDSTPYSLEYLPESRERPIPNTANPTPTANFVTETKYQTTARYYSPGDGYIYVTGTLNDTYHGSRSALCASAGGSYTEGSSNCTGGTPAYTQLNTYTANTNTCPSGYVANGATCNLVDVEKVPDGKCTAGLKAGYKDIDCPPAQTLPNTTSPSPFVAGGVTSSDGSQVVRAGYIETNGVKQYFDITISDGQNSPTSYIDYVRQTDTGTERITYGVTNGVVDSISRQSMPYEVVPYGGNYVSEAEWSAFISGISANPTFHTRVPNPISGGASNQFYTGQVVPITDANGQTQYVRVATNDLNSLSNRVTTVTPTTTGTGTTAGTVAVGGAIATGAISQIVSVANIPSDLARSGDIQAAQSAIVGAVGQVRTELQDDGSDLNDLNVPLITNPVAPLIDFLSPVSSFVPSVPVGVCPQPAFSAFGNSYAFTSHCTLLNDNAAAIQASSTLVALITAIFIVLSA